MTKHVDEMKIVDCVLNRLDEREKRQVEAHLKTCSTCREKWGHWRAVLAQESEIEPSDALNRRMTFSIQRKVAPFRHTRWRKPLFVLMSIAAFMMFAIGLKQHGDVWPIHEPDMAKKGYVIAQHDAVPEQKLLLEPETNRKPVMPLINENISGEIWLNIETNELMFFADGLVPLERNDYQLWIVHVGDYWNGHLLELRDGSTRVYYKAEDIRSLKYLKVSVEPQGGSLTPTGPEIFHVDLIEAEKGR